LLESRPLRWGGRERPRLVCWIDSKRGCAFWGVEVRILGLRTVRYTATAVHYTVTNGIRVTRIPSVCIPSRIANGTVRVSRRPSDGRRYVRPSKIERMCRSRLVLCRSICTRDPPYEQWLVGMGAGAVPFVIMETWLLAPGPPCEQVLAVVGDRCWGAVSLCTLTVDTHPTSRCSAWGVYHIVQRCCGTRDPPYEQRLVGMGQVLAMGAVLGLWEFGKGPLA
jgi:hypothetical protein